MKEIDFLPEWYKSGRRRKITYHTQYVILVGVFAIMIVWNFFATRSISKAQADLTVIAAQSAEAEAAKLEFARLKSRMRQMEKKAQSIEKIDSRIDVPGVLAELSFLIEKPIVLKKVELTAEEFAKPKTTKRSGRSRPLVRAARTGSTGNKTLPLGDVRFKVLIGGIAASSTDVAALIRKLEDSPYFFQVAPLYSRNAKISPATARQTDSDVETKKSRTAANIKVSEFEISCYLANYRQQ